MSVELISIIILVLFSAFFSAAETSLISLSKTQLHKFKKQKRRGFRSLLALHKHPSSMITTILIGNNVVNIAATALATQLIMDYLQRYNILNPAYITIITTLLVAFFLLVFGEITPKNLALAKRENLAILAAPLIRFFSLILSPFVNVLSLFSSILIKLLGGKQLSKGSLVTEQEILDLLDAGRDSGAIEHDEERMMSQVIRFGDTMVGETMTILEKVTAVSDQAKMHEIINVLKEKPRSRLPVYHQSKNNIVGVVYAKDLLFHLATEHMTARKFENFELITHQELIRKPFIVLANQKTSAVLKEMRAKKVHIAIVQDRQNKAVGIITIEDLIEEIVGEIQDEYEK